MFFIYYYIMNDKEKKVVKLINDWMKHRDIARTMWISVWIVSTIRNRYPNMIQISNKKVSNEKNVTTTKEENWVHEIRHEWDEIITREDFFNHIDFDEKKFEILSYQCNIRPVVIRAWKNETVLVKKYEHFLRCKPKYWFDINQSIDIINERITTINVPHNRYIKEKWQEDIIIVISDEHLWMDTSSSQFWYRYDHKILMEKCSEMIQKFSTKHYNRIVLIFCWDWLDGWNWYTTRWWHKLPQNMSSAEAFSNYVEFKAHIIQSLYQNCNKLIVRNINNSNHWWEFEKIANIAVEKIVERLDINYMSYDKFLNHIIIDNRCFIITHGKDQCDMKYWLPLHLNDKSVNFINNYIITHWLNNYEVILLKWDLHQFAYEKNKYFSYHNFPSFAPPSQRVQANFWDTLSWYSALVFNDDYIIRQDFVIEYEKFLEHNDEV